MERKLPLLAFLIIQNSLPTAIGSSSKCENITQGTECIELCCGITQFYVDAIQQCLHFQGTLQDVMGTWGSLIQNIAPTQPMHITEYGECPKSNATWSLTPMMIESCYSPFYDGDLNGYVLMKYFKVPCDRFPLPFTHPLVYLETAAFLLTLVLLPMMLSYTCTKKDKKDNLSFKLVTGYLTSMIATILTVVLCTYAIDGNDHLEGTWRINLIFLPKFFITSTFLWLSCIGCNVYIQYKEANEPNSKHKDQKRFIWFSIYVWLTTTAIVIISQFILRSAMVIDGPWYLIAYLNIFAFLVLSVKICLIRCRIAHLTSEKHLKCQLLIKIARLSVLMGIPRMLLLILDPLRVNVSTTYIFVMFLEPYVVFLAFIADHVKFSSLILCRCCRPGSQDLERATSTETNGTSTSV